MDALREFLEDLRGRGLERGHTLGLFHVLVGRRVSKADGTVIGRGLIWRELAALLKKVRWDKEAVRDLGLNPQDLPPRDRQQYWYGAISLARLNSVEARAAAAGIVALLQTLEYRVEG